MAAVTSITLKVKVQAGRDKGGTSIVRLVDNPGQGQDHTLLGLQEIRVPADQIASFKQGDVWTFVGTKN